MIFIHPKLRLYVIISVMFSNSPNSNFLSNIEHFRIKHAKEWHSRRSCI